MTRTRGGTVMASSVEFLSVSFITSPDSTCDESGLVCLYQLPLLMCPVEQKPLARSMNRSSTPRYDLHPRRAWNSDGIGKDGSLALSSRTVGSVAQNLLLGRSVRGPLRNVSSCRSTNDRRSRVRTIFVPRNRPGFRNGGKRLVGANGPYPCSPEIGTM